MDYMYDYRYAMDDELGVAFGIAYLVYYLFAIILGIAGYVLSSLGLYTIAKRRGINNPWLAWIPVVNAWIVGSISDQYRYVTKGQIKSKRKVLLILECVVMVMIVALMIIAGVGIVDMMPAMMDGSEGMMMAEAVSMVLWILVAVLGIAGVSIAYTIIYYMAMYDVYTSVNPPYNVVFLVLSIFFRVTEPFFIFFNRKKDLGMPPRCDIPVEPTVQPAPQYLPSQPSIQEPWENVPEE